MGLIEIQNCYLDSTTWLNAQELSFTKKNNKVDVYRVNISSNLSKLDDFSTLLSIDEIARSERYFQLKDKHRSIISRGALRYILGKYLNKTPVEISFGIGFNKKPYILNNEYNISYNISHSGDWILIAVAGSPIGVDIELINQNFNYQDILEDNFSNEEINYISLNNSIEKFFMLWTRKEALTKFSGKGLDENLKLIPCLDMIALTESDLLSSNSNLLVTSFKPHHQYLASVATHTSVSEIGFLDIHFF